MKWARRHWPILTAILLVAIGVVAIYNLREKWAAAKRDTAYRTALHSYSEVLGPGMTRKEVEDYFRVNKTYFRQMCCVDHRSIKRSWDDLVKIGQENPPWFCDAKNIYVAFQFSDAPAHDERLARDPSDKLTAITLYPWLEGCL
jgi:hypothetical protein